MRIAIRLREDQWETVTRALTLYANDVAKDAADVRPDFPNHAKGLDETVRNVTEAVDSIETQLETNA